MGVYLNSKSAYTLYKNESVKPYFVDKTRMLADLFPLVDEGSSYLCVTRPRRFGKTMAANMISSFFSRGCASEETFRRLDIASFPEYQKHLNRCNVIHMDLSEMDDACRSYDDYITGIKTVLREDLHDAYPDVPYREGAPISEDLKRIYLQTGETFLFVLDEWDAIFHADFVRETDRKRYLQFLKSLLKDKPYVSMAYMTGILPIAKYSSGSERNMFLEYTMAGEERFGDCFGFTDAEVSELYARYLDNVSHPRVTREGLRFWYDGYHTRTGERVYNPRSVVAALVNNNPGNYWTSSGPYDEILYYIEKNTDAVRDDLARMVSGIPVRANVREYAATAMELTTKDEIFSAMVVYGFLSFENGYVRIPNKELMDQFGHALQKEPSLGYVYRLTRESSRMLAATLAGDTETMAELLSFVHNTEIPLLRYNSEESLSAVVNLIYLAARDDYRIEREDKAGVGFVDYIFYPTTDPAADGIILELKVDKPPEAALSQIREKQYLLRFEGKPGEKALYTGRILAVGIGYDRKTKLHACRVEVLRERRV